MDWRLEHFETLDSTSSEALRRVEIGEAQHGLAICADQQQAGRGRHGRPWQSSAGNLYLSLLLDAQKVPCTPDFLPLLAGLAVRQSCMHWLPSHTLQLKWPNDVVLQGQKLAGILLESREQGGIRWLVVGIGINLANAPEGLPFPATCLLVQGADVTPSKAAEGVLTAFSAMLGACAARGQAELAAEWMQHAWGRGNLLTMQAGKRQLSGVFAGISPEGAVWLDTPGGRLTLTQGEIMEIRKKLPAESQPGKIDAADD